MKAYLKTTLARVPPTNVQATAVDAPPSVESSTSAPQGGLVLPRIQPPAHNPLHRFAQKVGWAQTHPVVLLPHAFETAEELRQDGWTLLPWRSVLGWDFTDGHDAVRALKEDWKALWMGHVHGEDVAPDDPKALACSQALGISWTPTQEARCALAYLDNGTPVGFAAFVPDGQLWQASAWHTSAEPDAERVLVAASLRAARDARSVLLHPGRQPGHALSRGAEWFWEYWPVRGGGWQGAMAGHALSMQRRWKDRVNAKLLHQHAV